MARARSSLARGLATASVSWGCWACRLAAAAPGDPGTPRYTAGSAGAGDSYFPYAGNGGYDVRHYDLDLDLHAARRRPRATRSTGSSTAWRRSTWSPRRTSTGSTSTCAA